MPGKDSGRKYEGIVDPPEKRGMDWVTCPRHNVSYPKGAQCPKCEEERRA